MGEMEQGVRETEEKGKMETKYVFSVTKAKARKKHMIKSWIRRLISAQCPGTGWHKHLDVSCVFGYKRGNSKQ